VFSNAIQAKKVFRHEGIYGGSHNLDALTTDYALKDVAFIVFPDGSFDKLMQIHTGPKPEPGATATIVGFGQHSLTEPDIIKDGGLYQQTATHTLGQFPVNLHPKYIAGLIYLNSTSLMPFHGDSGGPLLYQSKIAGVLSIGDPSQNKAYYASLSSAESKSLLSSVTSSGLKLGETYTDPSLPKEPSPAPSGMTDKGGKRQDAEPTNGCQ
jgi:hypothetical protein